MSSSAIQFQYDLLHLDALNSNTRTNAQSQRYKAMLGGAASVCVPFRRIWMKTLLFAVSSAVWLDAFWKLGACDVAHNRVLVVPLLFGLDIHYRGAFVDQPSGSAHPPSYDIIRAAE